MVPSCDHQGHGRRSVRLPAYDYAGRGPYFVTICTRHRDCLLGAVKSGTVHLSEMGHIAALAWSELVEHCPGVELGEWVVMPNHLHGIISLAEGRTPTLRVAIAAWRAMHPGARPAPEKAWPTGPAPRSLGAIVGSFKSATTKRINRLRATPGLPVWQRGYYEHIIGDDASLTRVRQYIADNPHNWRDRFCARTDVSSLIAERVDRVEA
jgi:putative transposase